MASLYHNNRNTKLSKALTPTKKRKNVVDKDFRKKVQVVFVNNLKLLQYENCESIQKKFNRICVVETIADQWSIQNSGVFQGYFHILGGTISQSNNINKNDLLIEALEKRVQEEKIEEVILATSATVEGQTTAFYIQDALKDINVKISKLAQGLPVGGEIENLDDGTLIYAFKNRHGINKN